MLTPTVVREYDRAAPDRDETETATFGLGCFWGPDATFGAIDGVIRTRVGYAGGSRPDPSYRALGDHTEVVQVDFDPAAVSYRTLLDYAFDLHSPYSQSGKRQYHNLVLATERQREPIDAYLDDTGHDPDRLETRIEPVSDFYPAEEYHQKYDLSGTRWITDAFDAAGYDAAAVRDSPAAAKLNGHVAGHDVSLPFLDARQDRP